jgi:hypothetical protein
VVAFVRSCGFARVFCYQEKTHDIHSLTTCHLYLFYFC